MKLWEYKEIAVNLEQLQDTPVINELNAAGRMGWEFAHMHEAMRQFPRDDHRTPVLLLYFKRELNPGNI